MQRVHVVHWRSAEAEPLLQLICNAGFTVFHEADASGPAIARAITANQPAAIVFDLSRLPSHSREIGAWLRRRKSTREIPLVFLGGEPEKVRKVRELLPDATYTTPSRLAAALKRICRNRPEATVIPPGPMERYQARTTAQKLGIVTGSRVGVLDPPRDYLAALGELPDDVDLIEDPPATQPLTLWFIHEKEAFLRALPRMRALATRTKLWLLWRKGSKTGVNPNAMRAAAREAGLIDYKVCSVDTRWSGMAFARRRA